MPRSIISFATLETIAVSKCERDRLAFSCLIYYNIYIYISHIGEREIGSHEEDLDDLNYLNCRYICYFDFHQ